jgi:hypothetical protein
MNLSKNLLRSAFRVRTVLGLRRQDARANVRAANDPEGEPRRRRVILMYFARTLRFLRSVRTPDAIWNQAFARYGF